MFNWFKRKPSELEKMAGVEEHQPLPSTKPSKPTKRPMSTKKLNAIGKPPPKSSTKKEEAIACPKCGTFDCIPLEEYQKRIKVSNTGMLSVSPYDILQCCNSRQQLKAMKEAEERNPGIWGKPSRSVSVSLVQTDDDIFS